MPARRLLCLALLDVDPPTTVLDRDGRATVERARLDPHAPVDCFYVYPTVSTDTTTVSDLVPDAAERNVGSPLKRLAQ